MIAEAGTWDDPHILGGATGLYIWYDATEECRRTKHGSPPTTEQDGTATQYGNIVG